MKEGRRPGADGSSSHELGGYKLKGKDEHKVRQQTGEITEDRGERGLKITTQLESYMLFLFLTLCISFATFSLLSHLQYFSNYLLSLLLSISKHFLLFSAILCPALTLPTVTFPATLSISFFIQPLLSL